MFLDIVTISVWIFFGFIGYFITCLILLALSDQIDLDALDREEWGKRIFRLILTIYVAVAIVVVMATFIMCGRAAWLFTGSDQGFGTETPDYFYRELWDE